MKFDRQEAFHIAAAAAPRLDMYSGIHKAMRSAMADTLCAVGRMDWDDAADRDAVTQRVLDLLSLCASHLKHENEHVHTAMEARAAGASSAIAHEHDEHVRHIVELRDAVAGLRDCVAAERAVRAQFLYRALAIFVAENFQHMHVEETAHNAVLWARYTDAELAEVHDALVASIPPQEMMAFARWLVPALSPAERLGLLADMRAKAPAEAFAAILDVARPHLRTDEWAKLARGLGLPPVPGLVAV